MTDKTREEFEAAFVAEYVADLASKAFFEPGMAERIVRATALERDEAGEYTAVVPRERFKGWVQGRASFVVELPERAWPIGHDYVLANYDVTVKGEESRDEAIEECRAAIIAVGGTVKP